MLCGQNILPLSYVSVFVFSILIIPTYWLLNKGGSGNAFLFFVLFCFFGREGVGQRKGKFKFL